MSDAQESPRPRKKSARKAIPGFGIKGRLGKHGRTVYGFTQAGRVRVLWRERGRRRLESWPDTPENRDRAIAFGEGVEKRLEAIATQGAPVPVFSPLTLRELWEAYVTAEFDHLRPGTQRNYRVRWMKFETMLGREHRADSVTREHLDQLRRELRKLGHEVNQIAHHVDVAKRVFRFGVDRDLIPPTKVITYEFKRSRDDKPLVIPEYSPAEAGKLLAQLEPSREEAVARDSRNWRTYVALIVFAFAGPRQKAARHLAWDDIDFEREMIRWVPEHDKLGYDREQPMPRPVVEALWVAYGWRRAFGYEGPWVLFRPGAGARDRGNGSYSTARARRQASSKKDVPWTYQAFNQALRRLEDAAGVVHVKWRAAHGFRRYVINTVLGATGNLVQAGQFVGDKDVRTLTRSYVRERPEQMRGIADTMGETGPKPALPENPEKS